MPINLREIFNKKVATVRVFSFTKPIPSQQYNNELEKNKVNNFSSEINIDIEIREIHKSIFPSNSSQKEMKLKKKKFQYFLKNNIIDFEKIQKLYFNTKNENNKIEKQPYYFLEVVEVFSLNSILREFRAYYDFYPLLSLRKFLFLIFKFFFLNIFQKILFFAILG